MSNCTKIVLNLLYCIVKNHETQIKLRDAKKQKQHPRLYRKHISLRKIWKILNFSNEYFFSKYAQIWRYADLLRYSEITLRHIYQTNGVSKTDVRHIVR